MKGKLLLVLMLTQVFGLANAGADANALRNQCKKESGSSLFGNVVADAVNPRRGNAHVVTDHSFPGWGPFLSVNGVEATFRAYAYGTCSGDYDNPEITACGAALASGCRSSLDLYKDNKGKVGTLTFRYDVVNSSESKVSEDDFLGKIVRADVTVVMKLVFTWDEEVEIDGKIETQSFEYVVNSLPFVFHLECRVNKPLNA